MADALKGRSILVTGAARGIGAAYALQASRCGARVVVSDIDQQGCRRTAERILDEGGDALAVACDVSSWQQAEHLVNSCVEEFGALDGLINNAGVFSVASPTEVTERDVTRLVQVNLVGTINCGLHALRVMLPRGSGSILNVTSGAQSGAKGLAIYGSTKGAVASLTYSWALDVEGTGVRVNAISPNAHTTMADAYERYLGAAARGQNIGKSPESNAPVALYLLSDLASDVNGQVLHIDEQHLALVTHPSLCKPTTQPTWTIDAVAHAMSHELNDSVQPIGLGPYGR